MNRDAPTSPAARAVPDDARSRILLASLSPKKLSKKRRPDRRSRPIDFDIDEFTAETREIPATRQPAPLTPPRLAPRFGEFEVKPITPEPEDSDLE